MVFRCILYSPGFKEETTDAVMDSLERANEARSATEHSDFLEVGDAEKDRLLKL
jgi:hypothetical protein